MEGERERERERRDEVGVFYPKHFLLFLMCLLGYKSNLHSFSPGVFHSPLYFLSFLLSFLLLSFSPVFPAAIYVVLVVVKQSNSWREKDKEVSWG